MYIGTSIGGAHGCTTAIGCRGSVGRTGRTRGPLQRVVGRCTTVSAWVARGVDVERSALHLGVTRLYAPPFTLTLRAPTSTTCSGHCIYMRTSTVRVLTCRPGLLALQVHVGLYLGIVVRNGLADSHKPLDGQVHPLADPGYRSGRPLRAERSFPVRHQRRYL